MLNEDRSTNTIYRVVIVFSMHIFLKCLNPVFLGLVYLKNTLIGTMKHLIVTMINTVDYGCHVMCVKLKSLQL